MPDTGYVFNGVGFIEAQERTDEHRTGVPAASLPLQVLQTAPLKRTSKVRAVNSGEQDAELRLRRLGGPVRSQTLEYLTALAQPGSKYIGQLQFANLVPGTVVIANAGAPPTIVDDGNGNLYDTGFVGIAANFRGTVNYLLGQFSLTYGAAPTEPVQAAYQHNDPIDYVSPVQAVSGAAHALPYTISVAAGGNGSIPFGRINPGTLTFTDGTTTWKDDGKGNLLETVPAVAKVGTVDYAAGVITITSGPAVVGALSGTYFFNPFGALTVKAAGSKLFDVSSQLPEITNPALGSGRNDPTVALVGQARPPSGTNTATQTNCVVEWTHYGEEPYRVQEVFSGFPPGGQDNNPALDHSINHL